MEPPRRFVVSGKRLLIRWLIIVACAILLSGIWIMLAHLGDSRETSRRTQGNQQRCVGLSCYDDSDCGSYCDCKKEEGAQVGVCVAK